jgi:hypothetical protein
MDTHLLRSSACGQEPDRFGTGLRPVELGAVLALSVATFLFWGGSLWRAPAGSSHVGRIAVSYLMVLPLVGGVLALERRFTWARLTSAVALVWSAKLVITASVYAYLATGSASPYEPARTWERASPPSAPSHRARPSALPRDHALAVTQARYDRTRLEVAPEDVLVVTNHDAGLHTLYMSRDGRVVRNVPLPAGGEPRRIPVPASPGEYQIGCESHAGEAAVLVVAEPTREDK